VTTMPVQFKKMTALQFSRRYPEAVEALDEEIDLGSMQFQDSPYGEVKIPGHGWRACLITHLIRSGGTVPTDQPGYFFDEDDGWQLCPQNQKFEEVK